jgi:glycosyltransferase involved in cell wall biosynthesis
MKIVAFHLVNEYSASPKILSKLLKGWVEDGLDVHLVTSLKKEGFLSNIEGITYHDNRYRHRKSKLFRLLRFVFSQVFSFISLYRYCKKGDVVFINTMMPFGGAILGRLKGCEVIYYLQETNIKTKQLKRFLRWVIRITTNEVIFVSHYLEQMERFPSTPSQVIHHSIEEGFGIKALSYKSKKHPPKNVLMVCALKPCKGIYEFVNLAKRCPDLDFLLVANAEAAAVEKFEAEVGFTENLTAIGRQTNLHPHYAWADAIVNLSRPDEWVEAFGLTILEGMAHKLPSIVPPVGGVTELVDDGVEGYRVDSREIDKVEAALRNIFEERRYKKMQRAVLAKLYEFSEKELINNSLKVIKHNKNFSRTRPSLALHEPALVSEQ